jgi:hypothetical protein
MGSDNSSRFWVIFDTCTRPEYYQDVHNLVALPSGASIRYEYRDKYLSKAAIDALGNDQWTPQPVLLVYGQWNNYQRGGNRPHPTPAQEMVWLSTRIGEMQLIVREGDNFFFDIKVGDYPRPESAQLVRILDPLVQARETPFDKWVSLSHEAEALASLRGGNEDANWQSIVDILGTPPMQFADDAFWRVRGPFKGNTRRRLEPTYVEEKVEVAEALETRKVRCLYDIFDSESCCIGITSHSPPPSSVRTSSGDNLRRKLELLPDKDGPLLVDGDAELDLRQYTEEIVTIRAKRYEEMDEKIGTLRLSSGTREDGWPLGAKLSLRFRVKKRRSKVLAGLLAGVAAFAVSGVAVRLWDKEPLLSGSLFVVGGCLIVITALLLTGKLSFKL